MGGNLFKTDNPQRLSREDYFKLIPEVLLLINSVQKYNLFVTKSVRDKEDFGDMDIVVEDFPNAKDVFIKKIHSLGLEYVPHGNGLSFLFKDFQIDLIFIQKESFEYACHYFSWNDLGNLIGRLSKTLGFKHGFNGLYREVRSLYAGGPILDNILLSYNFYDILNILKLDVEQFKLGFDTKEQMFKWLVKSPFFTSEIYQFENLNYTNRVRDRKRKTYNEFLDFVKNNSEYIKKAKQNYALSLYPKVKQREVELHTDEERCKNVKEVFNATVVFNTLNLEPCKESGMIFKQISNVLKNNGTDFLQLSSEEIQSLIISTYKGLYNV